MGICQVYLVVEIYFLSKSIIQIKIIFLYSFIVTENVKSYDNRLNLAMIVSYQNVSNK